MRGRFHFMWHPKIRGQEAAAVLLGQVVARTFTRRIETLSFFRQHTGHFRCNFLSFCNKTPTKLYQCVVGRAFKRVFDRKERSMRVQKGCAFPPRNHYLNVVCQHFFSVNNAHSAPLFRSIDAGTHQTIIEAH